ncbi:MAG TPA: hypothetical protein VMT27_07665 [Actinomycetes bacterium]|nr:hypothetical protein [Actinomycetes bacterium]
MTTEPAPVLTVLTRLCGPHCGVNVGVTRHCARCHEEYDFSTESKPAHGPFRAAHRG